MAPLSFILALEHWLPQQVEPGIAGKPHLGSGFDLHSGGMQVGDCVLQLGAIWRNPKHVLVLMGKWTDAAVYSLISLYLHRKCC